MPSSNDALYAQVQRRMIGSGEWDRISEALAYKLNESGWIDSLHHSKAARAGDATSVSKLIEEQGSQAQSSVPAKVKEEIMHMIRQYLDTQLDK